MTAPDTLPASDGLSYRPLIVGFMDGMKPEPRVTVSEWADLYRRLSSVSSAEPGPWRTSRTPYLREIQDNLSSLSIVQKIILKKGAQLGLTESSFNWLGYIIDISPAPTLLVQPTDQMVKRASKMRFDPMIEATPRLSEKIGPAKSRDSSNTITQKDFPGGTVVLTGANSPVGLRSMPAKNIILDEVDAYPTDLDGEGSPIDLAEARTRTFAKKKIFVISTPTTELKSIITKEFNDTDKRYFFVPCPHCGAEQHLYWERMRWEKGKPETTRYCCEHCDELIEERFKTEMLAAGRWKATNPDKADPTIVGYHINSLYSPYGWYSWANAVKDYEAALKDVNKMKTFINTVLGLEYVEDGDAPAWENLWNRREDYKLNEPRKDIAFITAGVDVQKDRLEVEIVGWKYGKISQSIDYRVLIGKTEEAEVWNKLRALLTEQWKREDGILMPILATAIDSGYNTSHVYNFCRSQDPSRVIAVKGQESQAVMLAAPRQVDVTQDGKKIGVTKVWNVGVSMIKSELYGWLKLNKNEDGTVPDGFCHFPQYDQHYFKGLTAEVVEFTLIRGFRKYQWVKKYERNEPLDCRVYARAAACLVGIDRLNAEDWVTIAGSYSQGEEKQNRERKKSSFWDR